MLADPSETNTGMQNRASHSRLQLLLNPRNDCKNEAFTVRTIETRMKSLI